MIRKKIVPNPTQEAVVNEEVHSDENTVIASDAIASESVEKQPDSINENAKPIKRTVRKIPLIVSEEITSENSEFSSSESLEIVEDFVADEKKTKKEKKDKLAGKEEKEALSKGKAKKKSKKQKKKVKAQKKKAQKEKQKEKAKDKKKKKKLKIKEKNAKIKKKAMKKLRKLLKKKSKK
ncbi:hypothetical protein [Flavobacterium geliluteum]|uniref:Uncharacterized protein n=1 Tax=Flavobacterium geliluteum TaxID=2816120 RepID=A0A940X9B2_9FLAO|nr:hypothetical protein [Flavobacterium geliluteum]MBP4139050.1 hypothetical protein [Flavobacterium geliluteum]